MKLSIVLNALALIAFSALTVLAFWQAHGQEQLFQDFRSAAQNYVQDTYYVRAGYRNAVVMLVPTLLLLVGIVLQLASYVRGAK